MTREPQPNQDRPDINDIRNLRTTIIRRLLRILWELMKIITLNAGVGLIYFDEEKGKIIIMYEPDKNKAIKEIEENAKNGISRKKEYRVKVEI